MLKHPKLPEAVRLRVVAPKPTAVYRWFATIGTVVDLDARTMSFDSAGKIVELMPAGTKFAPGDTLGKLAGAAALEAELAKNKSKLAVFEQLRDSMKASGKKGDLRDAEDKVAARKKMVDGVQADLAKLVLRALEAGSIGETSQKVGATVAPKMPVLKWRGRSLHGDFTMDQEDFAKASKLEFCRVEVSGLGTPGTTPGAQTPGTAAPAAAPTGSARRRLRRRRRRRRAPLRRLHAAAARAPARQRRAVAAAQVHRDAAERRGPRHGAAAAPRAQALRRRLPAARVGGRDGAEARRYLLVIVR